MNSVKIDSVLRKIGNKPGKILAIFGGVHGNEVVGIKAIEEFEKDLQISKGAVYLVRANPKAILAEARQVEKNLNRCFFEKNEGDSYEDKRARQLMGLMDKCDGILDLHSFNSGEGLPFAVCSKDSFDLAEKFDVRLISYGWDKIEPGSSEDYINRQGKKGVSLECGPTIEAEKYLPFAKKAVLQFLKYFDVLESDVDYSDNPKNFFKVEEIVKKKSSNFKFTRKYVDFEKLKSGELIATDSNHRYFAGENQCILFPRGNKPIGGEVFLLGKFKN